MERMVLRLLESFPDLVVSVEGQEAERDLVRTRLTLSGTARGAGVMWYPPTRRCGCAQIRGPRKHGGIREPRG